MKKIVTSLMLLIVPAISFASDDFSAKVSVKGQVVSEAGTLVNGVSWALLNWKTGTQYCGGRSHKTFEAAKTKNELPKPLSNGVIEGTCSITLGGLVAERKDLKMIFSGDGYVSFSNGKEIVPLNLSSSVNNATLTVSDSSLANFPFKIGPGDGKERAMNVLMPGYVAPVVAEPKPQDDGVKVISNGVTQPEGSIPNKAFLDGISLSATDQSLPSIQSPGTKPEQIKIIDVSNQKIVRVEIVGIQPKEPSLVVNIEGSSFLWNKGAENAYAIAISPSEKTMTVSVPDYGYSKAFSTSDRVLKISLDIKKKENELKNAVTEGATTESQSGPGTVPFVFRTDDFVSGKFDASFVSSSGEERGISVSKAKWLEWSPGFSYVNDACQKGFCSYAGTVSGKKISKIKAGNREVLAYLDSVPPYSKDALPEADQEPGNTGTSKIALLVLVLMAGIGGAYFFFNRKPGTENT